MTTTYDRPHGYHQLYDTPEFKDLRRRHRRLAFTLTAAFFSLYMLYVLLCTYAPELVTFKVIGNINCALLLGLGQFASTFAIASGYSRAARRRLDPLAAQLKDEVTDPAVGPQAYRQRSV
ncbi:DUF485 domain-containing protein [Streptomyces sp. NPDC101110]|uniref:DUF485 domain-containing protein n=1 Tax=unclassified Streptomyces TaxID=2593676 RepID=UPI0038100BF9